MPRNSKCPPHTFCINKTLLAIISVSMILFALIYHSKYKFVSINDHVETKSTRNYIFQMKDSSRINDTFHDVYKPPQQENPYIQNIPNTLQINVPTSFRPTEYKQVGILTRSDPSDQNRERETILALFGRPVHKSGSKWQYYTMTDKSQGIKLPVKYKNKTCSSSYGCDELYSGDEVHVQGYNEAFNVTIYDVENMHYF